MGKIKLNSTVSSKVLLPLIIFLIFLVFYPSIYNDFVNWDDPAYIFDNPLVKELSLSNIKRIFSTFVNSNYQPLSVLTFSIEYKFFKLNPRAYHLNNIILHAINSFLVFCFILSLTKNKITAFIVTVLFGLHPTRVESVTWITERKDVLFSFFYLSSLNTYLSYNRGIKKSFYKLFLCWMLFLFALLSKPTAVSLPIVMLLIDYYMQDSFNKAKIFEKVPFFAMSFIFGVIAVLGTFTPDVNIFTISKALSIRLDPGYLSFVDPYNLFERISLISHTLISYLVKVFWIIGLACYYPYPTKINGYLPVTYYLSPLFLIIIVFIIFKIFKKYKFVLFGSLFFLFTIIFNLPFKSVGHVHIMADRFTYIPYIGLFFIIGETANSFFRLNYDYARKRKKIITAVTLIILICIIECTYYDIKTWKNSATLWSNVIRKYPNLALGYFNRADYYYDIADFDLALYDYNNAIKYYPKYYQAFNNRGNVYLAKKNLEYAIRDYSIAINIKPDYVNALLNRAKCYSFINEKDKAINDYSRVLSIDPKNENTLIEKLKLL